ncbi:MAG: hypothetical protein ACI8VW_000536 [bacterium]|jgi:hypothetical protein
MAQNYKFFFDKNGTPRARGPAGEKPLMTYLELDVQGSDHICRDLMNDLTAIEDGSTDLREFVGNAHCIRFTPECVLITTNQLPDESERNGAIATGLAESKLPVLDNLPYEAGLKRFREVLEDWEAFILDDQIDDSLSEDDYH